jgi:hypothetical protein
VTGVEKRGVKILMEIQKQAVDLDEEAGEWVCAPLSSSYWNLSNLLRATGT